MRTKRFSFAVQAVAIAILLFVLVPVSWAQAGATLTGTVTDPSGAVVPKAGVVLKNEASGDLRRSVSNDEGYFTFAAVPPGSYTVTVQMQGFNNWEVTAVVLNAGDKRHLSNITLKPGTTKETITVEAVSEQITPVDSGEKSAVISSRVMQNVAIVGQNAAEFIKIMPGMAMTAGAMNRSSYAGADEATGNGPVQNFSPNGLRIAALDITSDGAHIVDPGCNCGQSVNTNIEMTAEVKVLTSNFGAEASKGPAVVQAISKSGGSQFHGDVFFYARHNSLDANDWIGNSLGTLPTGKMLSPRPSTSYWYPGITLGGPVLLPKTNFNRNRDKLFFFFGTEYYKQNVDNGYYLATTPTADMRKGIWTDTAYLTNMGKAGGAIGSQPNGQGFVGGILPPSLIDKNGLAHMSVLPLPNLDPGNTAAPGYNYVNSGIRYSNMYQIRPKIDYAISDNTKLYILYNAQRDSRQESLDTLWTGNGQSWASPTVPYPSPIVEKTQSDQVTANLTHVFNPTLTNETVFTYTYLNLPNSFADRTKVDRGGLGFDYGMLFQHDDPAHMIFPQMTGWGNGIANILNGGFELNGTVYAKKSMPSVYDNLSKVWGTHTSKFGFYWERTFNEQPGNGAVNGQAIYSNWGSNGTGNAYADMLIGQTTQYVEQNFDTVPAFRYMSIDFYGQDSWKVSRRLTLEYGMRVQHLGPWSDLKGTGFADFFPSKYDPSAPASALTGFAWHKIDPSVPLSGSKSRMFFYNPRVGFAWDLFGSGKTVLRGGFGVYRYHDEQNVQNQALGVTQGSYTVTLWSPKWDQIAGQGTSFGPGDLGALDPTDNQQPRTMSYSFTVAQRMPWASVLEVAYVGNKADYLSNYNNSLSQINYAPIGSEFRAYGWKKDYSGGEQGAVRAYPTYGKNIKIINHKMYSNYNGLQVSWNKQAGHFTFMTNYTFSKALGIRGENGAAVGDPLNIKNDYGTLPNNRTHIFNAAYVYELPNATKSKALGALVNNWQVSGMTQFQSGADLQAAVSSNLSYSAYIPEGTTFMGVTVPAGDHSWSVSSDRNLGSNDLTVMPKLTCDPRKGLGKNQFFNPSCFTMAPIGTNGDYIWPMLQGPGFINSDLSLFKSFVMGAKENRKLQFRFSAYNFLNHPVRTFISNDNNLKLNFNYDGSLANDRTGFADKKTGHRIMQMMVKFTW